MNGTTYLADVYLPARPALRPSTREQYALSARLLDEFSGGTPIHDWTPDLLCRWLASLSGSAATINSKRRAACTLWRAAVRHAPVEDVPKRKEPRRVPQAWTLAEIEAIQSECRRQPGTIGGVNAADWWESLLLAVFDTGHRISAMLATVPADCNLADGWLLIRAEEEKTWADKIYQLADDTREVLSRHYDATRSRLWPWPYHTHTIWPKFRRIVRAAKVRYPGEHCNLFHRVRRTSGSLVEQAGGSGARHLGVTEAVFQRSYNDPTFSGGAVHLLPRPTPRPTLRIVG